MTDVLAGLRGQRFKTDESAKISDEAEQAVRDMLKALDSLLDLRWFPTVVYDHERQQFSGRYALICRWADNDPRWPLYRKGDIGDPFDCLGWFTQDAATGEWHTPGGVPVDPMAMEAKLVEFLGKMDLEREPWKKRMKRVHEENLEQRRRAKKDIVDDAMDRMIHFRKRVAGESIVPVGIDLRSATPDS